MRLLTLDSGGNVSLSKDLRDNIPPYGILSHTWGAESEEVTFNDLEDGRNHTVGSRPARTKAGYKKILFCGQQAKKDGLDYFWVDTCCINKSDLVELQEALNSMFRWYQDSAKCYVYLADVTSRKRDSDGEAQTICSLRLSRWFTRGWTLQELLAPRSVEFYSRDGDHLGNRDSLGPLLHDITGIPMTALQGAKLADFGIKERMRWVEPRETTKPEDRVYCLLGIFGAKMFLLYGEGEEGALERLKDEINKQQRNDLDEIKLLSVKPGPARDRDTDDPSQDIKRQELLARREQLMELLGFEHMDSRRANIKTAHTKTCAWFLQHSAFRDWNNPAKLEQHHGFLWIKGKPGAGKSTLMKFAYTNAARARWDNELLLSFFFNARGDTLERSTTGMYRSLLFQLLTKANNLQEVLDEADLPAKVRSRSSAWTLDVLRDLFTAAVGKLTKNNQRVRCFIDALDECNEYDVQNMILYFENLGEGLGDRLHMCFASRHYPTIVVRNGLELILEHELGHDNDLVSYVKSHLIVKNEALLQDLQQRIPEKANGVFMWAVLVVDILNNEIRRGRIFNIHKRLEEIPAGLSDLFKDMLRRDCTNMDELLLCIQWILFAKRPLTSREFYHAMMVGLVPDSEPIDEGYLKAVTDDDVLNFVHDCSKGLAELTTSTRRRKGDTAQRSTTVQFIHESVRDFLWKDKGLYELWPQLETGGESSSNEKLKQCCAKYLTIDIENFFPIVKKLPGVGTAEGVALRQDVELRFPFLRYASHEVFYHANEAARDISQTDFVRSVPLSMWTRKFNLSCEKARRYFDTTLLFVLAETNSGRLIELLPIIDLERREARGHRKYAFFVALANEAWDALRYMLKRYDHDDLDGVLNSMKSTKLDKQGLLDRSLTPMQWALNNRIESLAEMLAEQWANRWIGRDPSLRNTPFVSIETAMSLGYQLVLDRLLSSLTNPRNEVAQRTLNAAVRHGRLKEAQSLLDLGCKLSSSDMKDGIILAISNGYLDMVPTLLSNGALVNPELRSTDGTGIGEQQRTPLSEASLRGHLPTVMQLLQSGAHILIRDLDGEDALLNAARNGHRDIVELLLDEGARLYRPNYDCMTALSWASKRGHEDVVRLLLARGALTDAYRDLGHKYIDHLHMQNRAPLSYAAGEGHLGVVTLLLDHGAGLDHPDEHGATALTWAARQGHDRVVALLLSRGALPDAYRNLSGHGITSLSGQYRAPLSYAAEQGHFRIVQTLLQHRANPWGTDARGRTAITVAIIYKRGDVVELLLQRALGSHTTEPRGLRSLADHLERFEELAKPSLEDTGDCLSSLPEVLLWAADGGIESLVRAILEKDIQLVAMEGLSGVTPLMLAALAGSVRTMQCLLSYGADRNARDWLGQTALFYACKSGDVNAVQCLTDQHADINVVSWASGTALHDAASLPSPHQPSSALMIRLLISRGAKIGDTNSMGETALDKAENNENRDAVRALLESGAVRRPERPPSQ